MAELSTRSKKYIVPSYSLTGDLIAFLKCRLQYRFNNKGSLPPAIPVQLWFGEFIHGVMEEAYLIWKKELENTGVSKSRWTFDEVQAISVEVAKRLKSKGLKPYSHIFCNCTEKGSKGWCEDENHPHHLVANERAFFAVNGWGPHLFPLIMDNEKKLQGIRPMPNYDPDKSRANLYSITGVADVISSINMEKCSPNNKLVSLLRENKKINELIEKNPEFEVIIDYKGTARPDERGKPDEQAEWKQFGWQIATYMWLQEQNLKASGIDKPIVAGVLLFLNELYPSDEDCKKMARMDHNYLRDECHATDRDLQILEEGNSDNYRYLSGEFLMRRSIRIVEYDPQMIEESLKAFDEVVSDLESCVLNEMHNPKDVISCWSCSEYDQHRCIACDLKNICDSAKQTPRVP